jgi:hypothetical protein
MCAAGLSATSLPSSSYYEGSSIFYENGLAGQIDFAVYDTQSSNEFSDAGFQAPGGSTERYIYAYQISCNEQYSSEAFGYLAVSGIGADSISGDDVIGAVEDSPDSGIEPGESYFTNERTTAVWEFNDVLFVGGEHSWFLVYTSEEDYTTGRYQVLPNDNDEIPFANNPEPATFGLFGMGAYWFFRKRKAAKV